jgi:hypothetical protein
LFCPGQHTGPVYILQLHKKIFSTIHQQHVQELNQTKFVLWHFSPTGILECNLYYIRSFTYVFFFYVRSIARHDMHLQFDISANAFEIRAIQSPKCVVCCVVDCTISLIQCNNDTSQNYVLVKKIL